jgi:hypothetical protein
MPSAKSSTQTTRTKTPTETPLSRNKSSVGPFWSDDDRPEWKSGTTFLIREFVDKPPMPWFKRNQDIWRELFFFFILLGVGGLLISYNESLINRNEFISSMFFASGFIPLIQSVIFDLIPRAITTANNAQQQHHQPQGTNNTIRLDEMFSILLSAIFLIAAVLLYPKPEDAEDAWDIVCGKTLFEAGLIYFITRVLFFVPNPLDQIRKLKNEIDELKQSMAIGLADGYFWNLVREIAVDVRDAQGLLELQHVGKDKDGNDLKPVRKHIHRFLIIVPRELNSEIEDPIANEINAHKKSETFKDCKIEKSVNRDYSSRVKFVTDLYSFSSSSSLSAGTSKNKSYHDGIIFDIPTTITALFMSLRDYKNGNLDHHHGKDTNIDTTKFQKEISIFTHRIAWQLKKANLEEYVKVIEVENLENIVDKIIAVHRHFQEENREEKDANSRVLLDQHHGAKVIDLLGGGAVAATEVDIL